MSFTSPEFWIFLPVVFCLYYICPKSCRWICLLTASYVFYGFAGIPYILLLAYVTLAAFLAAKFLEKTADQRLRLPAQETKQVPDR